MNLVKNIERTVIKTSIASLLLLIPITNSNAITVSEIKNPRRYAGNWVSDMANVLSDNTESQLNQIIDDLEQTHGTEIAVVTVPNTENYATPKAFTTELFDYWGIGKEGQNNGILFLISISDRRVEIETGSGLQTILPDAKVSQIIQTKIKPQYKQGNFDWGTLEGTQALVAVFNPPTINSTTVNTSTTTVDNINFILKYGKWAVAAFLGGMGIIAFRNSRRTYISPNSQRFDIKGYKNQKFYCQQCKQAMTLEDNISLTEPQKKALEIGAVSFQGYKCSQCHSNEETPILIAIEELDNSNFRCPVCREFTVIGTEEIIAQPTYDLKGLCKIEKNCLCCDYEKEEMRGIPKLKRRSQSNNHNNDTYYDNTCSSYNNNDSSYSSSYSSDSSSYSGDSGSSGSDFGGGSSDGGGSGDDW